MKFSWGIELTCHRPGIIPYYKTSTGLLSMIYLYTKMPLESDWSISDLARFVLVCYFTQLSLALVPRPHPAHARRRSLRVSQLQFLGLVPEV